MRKSRAAVAFAALLSLSCSERSAPSSAGASGRSTDAQRQPGAGGAAKSPNDEVDELVRENLDAELVEQPITATWLGVHAWDGEIDDVRPEAQGARSGAAAPAARAAARDRRQEARQRPRLRSPAARASRRSCALYAHRAAPARAQPACSTATWRSRRSTSSSPTSSWRPKIGCARSTPACGRSAACSTRRAATCRPSAPELAVRRAIEVAQATKGFLAETLPRAMQGVPDPKLLDELRNATGDASRALDEFAAWLHARPLAARPWRLRARPRSPDGDAAPRRRASTSRPSSWCRSASASSRTRAAASTTPRARRPARPGVDINKLLEEDHGKPEELLTSAQQMLESAVEFARTQHLWAPPQPERPKVIEMPPALWGYMQLSMPGPLEQHAHDGLPVRRSRSTRAGPTGASRSTCAPSIGR